ncbi:MAG: hypothetical protein E3J72_11190 [Planctomycetota bacterium]|nr:MAG: hypothetical protein E3J72_11190 [Planctomycetota bacterium]
MHLDPDFECLTYGDRKRNKGISKHRGNQIAELKPDDLIVFYAGLRQRERRAELVYAIIGFYVVDNVTPAYKFKKPKWCLNAHTRRKPLEQDIVVTARPGKSGRLERCIPIGEYRDDAYRVKKSLLKIWGGLSVKNGYIQRSGTLPRFNDPKKFIRWFRKQKPRLIQRNN